MSLLSLLTISTFVLLISKKINFPYTVLLVIVGLILVPLSKIDYFNFINHFELTPDILFLVFLPVLLFESAYNINYRHLVNNWRIITSLAVFWLILSAFIVWWALFYILPFVWFDIPFLVCLLFWFLISATDPVAVISIFKSIWAPRRLALIFEWESLFNDGTSVALFLVVLWIILEWSVISPDVFTMWIISFLSMLFWWFIFWWITWVVFSKIIWYVKNNESVEITLTMVLAHTTFILAEFITHHTVIFGFNLQISWVIATVVAWIIIWNYWRYKISPKVEKHMESFWEFFAFVSNSLVFILMWLILSHIDIDFMQFILPITVVIIVVMISRAISVYFPVWILNYMWCEEKVPTKWQHLLSWWSLRWALALMMALMIPWEWHINYNKILEFQKNVWWDFDFSIRDFILVITISSIMFTLLIKATTISWMMKKMWVDKLNKLEEFEYEEWKILINFKVLDKLNKLLNKHYLTNDEYIELKNKYKIKLEEAVLALKKLLETQWKTKAYVLIKRAISLHALWIEKQYLKDLFHYNEISEENFKFILHKIIRQKERLELSKSQLSWNVSDSNYDYDIFETCANKLRFQENTVLDRYVRNRTRSIITRKVIKELKELREIDFWFDVSIFDDVISIYIEFNKTAEEKKDKIFSENKKSITLIDTKLVDKSLLKYEEKIVKDLYDRDIITPKLYIKFNEEIENEIYIDINKSSK